MGKRIFRISPEQAVKDQAQLLGQELNVVLKTGAVFLGKLLKVDETSLFCENMRGKSVVFQAVDVKEIVYDRHSNY